MCLSRIIQLFVWCLLFTIGAARAVTLDEVVSGADKMYRGRIAELARAGMLDRDAAFLSRIERIARRLREQATRDDPAAALLSWEIHTSSDPDGNASCMAGGKILVSQAYVERLGLSDAELAFVLSHEMQHTLLLHNLKEYEEALRLEPGWLAKPFSTLEDAVDNDASLMAKLAPLNREQEMEADRAGLAMATRAGWRARHLVGYFRKLVQANGNSNSGSAIHPSPMQRWRAARSQAERLEADKGSAAPSSSLQMKQ
jgi:predicted Zn-dependent protease